MGTNNGPKYWHRRIEEHRNHRNKMIELNMDITKAMTSYLKTVGETSDFNIRFEDNGTIKLSCDGDLFNLEQIFDFCDVFNLSLIINNRTMVENHLEDNTAIRTKYLFTTHAVKEKED